MAASKTLKSSDRQDIIKKVTTELKKRYKGNPPKQSRSVMETLIYATCLEDSSYEEAEQAIQKLLDGFFDLNEIRVSSVDEIKRVIGKMQAVDWKAMRLREALQDIFEKQYSFDLEPLKRKTLELAQKELSKISHQTHFSQSFTLQTCLQAHLVPVDGSMLKALVWLGLTESDATVEHASEQLKAAMKKADGPYFCYLLKGLAIDAELAPAFSYPVHDADPHDAHKRLADLIKNGPQKPSKKASKAAEPVPAKAAAKTTTVTKKKPEAKAESKKPVPAKPKPAAAAPKKVTKKKPAKKATKGRK